MIGLLAGLLAATAQAAGLPGEADYAPPEMKVDPFRPAVLSPETLTAESADVTEGLSLGLAFGHVKDPLVWQPTDGEPVSLLASAASLGFSLGWGRGPVGLGLSAPLYPYVGEGTGGANALLGTAIGDLDLSAKAVTRWDGPLDLGAIAHLDVPLGGAAMMVGQPGFGGELSGIARYAPADLSLGGAAPFATVNLGARIQPEVTLYNAVSDDALVYRAAGGARWQDAGLSAELAGATPLSAFGEVASSPLEGLVGAWWSPTSGATTIRAGLGWGVVGGIGAPGRRVILGVSRRLRATP